MSPAARALRIVAPADAAGRVSAELSERGTLGLEVLREDEREHELLAYFPAEGPDPLPDLRGLLSPLGARVEPAAVPDVDWVAAFRAGFQGARAGSFRILPSWCEDPPEPGERLLRVDPAGAFGTGTHETTRLCLTELERRPPGRRAADVGCGTGLLGLAALAHGWGEVVGVDRDPAAVGEAARNAALNALPLRVVLGDGGRALRRGAFELLLANLTVEILSERREELVACLAPRGAAILSGLLEADAAPLARAWASGGASTRVRLDGEWAALVVELA